LHIAGFLAAGQVGHGELQNQNLGTRI
jgi:hypothetical protein